MALKVLSIDDSTVIRNIIKRAFSLYHCTFYESSNGQEGIKLAMNVHPDLILLDIDMPVMNGWDTLACLRFEDRLKETPVFMLTANAEEKNMKRAEALGVVDFLVKPFRPEEIVERINQFVDLTAYS